MAMITSADNPPWPPDCTLAGLAAAGLPAASNVRFKLFTLDHRLVRGKVGKRSPAEADLVGAAALAATRRSPGTGRWFSGLSRSAVAPSCQALAAPNAGVCIGAVRPRPDIRARGPSQSVPLVRPEAPRTCVSLSIPADQEHAPTAGRTTATPPMARSRPATLAPGWRCRG